MESRRGVRAAAINQCMGRNCGVEALKLALSLVSNDKGVKQSQCWCNKVVHSRGAVVKVGPYRVQCPALQACSAGHQIGLKQQHARCRVESRAEMAQWRRRNGPPGPCLPLRVTPRLTCTVAHSTFTQHTQGSSRTRCAAVYYFQISDTSLHKRHSLLLPQKPRRAETLSPVLAEIGRKQWGNQKTLAKCLQNGPNSSKP